MGRCRRIKSLSRPWSRQNVGRNPDLGRYMSDPLCETQVMKSNFGRRAPANGNDEDKLSGLIELGMGSEALRVAARILERRNPTPGEVMESIIAIGVFASVPARWKPRVDALVARLSKRRRHRMRETFILFYATIGDERFEEFIRAPRSFAPETIFLVVKALLGKGKQDQAKKFIMRARVPDNPDAFDYLAEAYASVLSANGDYFGAWVARRRCPLTTPVTRDIVEGMVKSSLAMTIRDLDERIEYVQAQIENGDDETALIVPGNHDALLEDSAAAFRKWRSKLARLFSKEDLRLFALGGGGLTST